MFFMVPSGCNRAGPLLSRTPRRYKNGRTVDDRDRRERCRGRNQRPDDRPGHHSRRLHCGCRRRVGPVLLGGTIIAVTALRTLSKLTADVGGPLSIEIGKGLYLAIAGGTILAFAGLALWIRG